MTKLGKYLQYLKSIYAQELSQGFTNLSFEDWFELVTQDDDEYKELLAQERKENQ